MRLFSRVEAHREPSSRSFRPLLSATAAVVVAVHVVDDNFLQPQAGQQATDHLVSGLVPLGIIAVGAWACPKVRAGARGLLTIALGLFGLIIGGTEAGYYTAQIGPSGD